MNYITEYWKEIEGGKCVVSRRVRKVYEQLARRIEQPEAGGAISSTKRRRFDRLNL